MKAIGTALALVLLLALPLRSQDKAAQKPTEGDKAKVQDPALERRDPTESDLPRAAGPRPVIPPLSLKGIVIAAEKGGSAILEMNASHYRIRKGDLITLGVTPGAAPPQAAPAYSQTSTPKTAPRPAAAPAAAGGVPTVLHVVSITVDEVRIEVSPSGEVIILR